MQVPATALALLLGCALFTCTPQARAQEPSGSVAISGPGAPLFPVATFEPATYIAAESGWSWYDDSETLAIIVMPSSADPTKASFVSVTEAEGESWFALGIFAPLSGVSIDGDTVTFTSTSLPLDGSTAASALVLNGTLTRPSSVGTQRASFGGVKIGFDGGGGD